MKKLSALAREILFALLLAIVSLSLLFVNTVSAQETTSTFTLDPLLQDIDDFVSTVSIAFNDPNIQGSSNEMFVCLEQDLCIDNKDIRNGIIDGKLEDIAKASRGLGKEDVDEKTIQRFRLDEDSKIIVCGDGDKKLKSGCDKNDYFFPGSVYLLSVYEKTDDDLYILRSVAGFYVNHGAPEVKIKPKSRLKPEDQFEITLSSKNIRPGGKDRNNYKVVVDGPGIKRKTYFQEGTGEDCGSLSRVDQSIDITLPKNDGLTFGNYTIRISEQINEKSECIGGFTYYQIDCKVDPNPLKSSCEKPVKDPDRGDLTALIELYSKLGGYGGSHRLPCAKLKDGASFTNPLSGGSGITYVENPLDCETYDSAIGSIPLDVKSFITKLFSFVLGIAGVAALLLIIYGGYMYMMSQGDKEKTKHAREIITAAVIGLLFVIFSFVILQVIAGDILTIPGFGGDTPIPDPIEIPVGGF